MYTKFLECVKRDYSEEKRRITDYILSYPNPEEKLEKLKNKYYEKIILTTYKKIFIEILTQHDNIDKFIILIEVYMYRYKKYINEDDVIKVQIKNKNLEVKIIFIDEYINKNNIDISYLLIPVFVIDPYILLNNIFERCPPVYKIVNGENNYISAWYLFKEVKKIYLINKPSDNIPKIEPPKPFRNDIIICPPCPCV